MSDFAHTSGHRRQYSADRDLAPHATLPMGLALVSWIGASALLWGALLSIAALLH